MGDRAERKTGDGNDGIGRPGARRNRPSKPGDEVVAFSILIPASMADELEKLARSGERSRTAEIRLALRHHIAAANASQARKRRSTTKTNATPKPPKVAA